MPASGLVAGDLGSGRPGGAVPVTLPPGMTGDEMQTRLMAAADSVAGRRKRTLVGEETSLLHTLLTVQRVSDEGVMPTPASEETASQAHRVSSPGGSNRGDGERGCDASACVPVHVCMRAGEDARVFEEYVHVCVRF